MKKLIVAFIFLLSGCDLKDEKPDPYSKLPSLTPSEIISLHKFCKSQPNYNNSSIIKRGQDAKGVLCTFTDSDVKMGLPSSYSWDAEKLKQKLEGENNEQKQK